MRILLVFVATVATALIWAGSGSAILPPEAVAHGSCGLVNALPRAGGTPAFQGTEVGEECEREHGPP
jgi:hypothetical protein